MHVDFQLLNEVLPLGLAHEVYLGSGVSGDSKVSNESQCVTWNLGKRVKLSVDTTRTDIIYQSVFFVINVYIVL